MFNSENIKKLTLILVTIAALVLIGVLALKRTAFDYSLSADEMVNQILLREGEITPEEAGRIIAFEETEYQLIDLRNPFEYQKGYLGNALNIPGKRILEKEFLNLFQSFNRDSIKVVLYGSYPVDTNGPWMILKQLGFTNIWILPWGYNYLSSRSTGTDEKSRIPEFSPEDIRYDIPSIITAARSGLPDESEISDLEQIIPVRKKKKSVTEGGC